MIKNLEKAKVLAKDLIEQKEIPVPVTSEWHDAVVALYQELEKTAKDTERIDFLQSHNGRFNQASILSKSSDGGPPYRCSSGFYDGNTIRKAIDSAKEGAEKKT